MVVVVVGGGGDYSREAIIFNISVKVRGGGGKEIRYPPFDQLMPDVSSYK